MLHLEMANNKIVEIALSVTLSLIFDGTKVPKSLDLSTTFQCIIGRAAPHLFLSFEGLSKDWVRSN